ncbi:hypothetical protein G9P44_004384 [Scheffersomyces stipitis]|nr:hypothetical protein G9P44_004384 [Scheffersomyces stipitis]
MPAPATTTSVDEQTLSVIDHLTKSYDNKSEIDSTLIDDYITVLGSIDLLGAIADFIPIINHILTDNLYHQIDPNRLLIELLQKIVSRLSFGQIVSVYSPEFIVSSLASSDNVPITKLCLSIIIQKLHEPETVSFIAENCISFILLKNYLSDAKLDLGIVNQIELYVNSLILNDVTNLLEEILTDTKFVILYNSIRNSENTILLARLLDFILILLTYKVDLPLDPRLYTFSNVEIVTFKDDPLFLILLVQFYVKLVQVLNHSTENKFSVLEEVSPVIGNFVNLYKDPTTDDFVKVEVIDILVKLSYATNSLLIEYGLELALNSELFKSHNLIKVYEYNEPDIKLLSNVNPDLIVHSSNVIYEDVLSNLSLLNNKQYFPILLNFIGSADVFPRLEQDYFTTKLKHLPADKLYVILLEFSKFSHSRKFLLSNATLTNDYLLDNDNLTFVNNELWHTKLQVLENLVNATDSDSPELAHWKPYLQDSFNLMRHGKKIRDVVPQVSILDETL